MVHTVCALVLLFLGASGASSAKQKNVLFFAVDDLRPEINAFDPDISVPGTTHAKMFTPNIDALARKSLVLRKNYCQQAICGPTRASLLTSRRPDRTKVWDLSSYWRKVGGNFTTIPQLFRQHGYETVGMGKIFHPGTASGGVKGHNLPGHGGGDDQPYSWSRPYWHAPNLNFWGGKHPTGAGVRPFHPGVSVLPVPAEIEANHPLPDAQIAERAVDTLAGFLQPGNLSEGQRFFLGVGFHRPHLPFIFPARLLRHYPNESVAPPTDQQPPAGMPPVAWSDSVELKEYADLVHMDWSGAPGTVLPPGKVRELRRGYYAAVTHTDECLGRVMAALNSSRYSGNTVVVFWGDHGWQLGEHGIWAKITNYEFATHAPLMIHDPELTSRGIITSDQYSEHVDLMPTLSALALDVTIPSCASISASLDVELCTEGVSLVPLMKDPSVPVKNGSFSQYPRPFSGQPATSAWHTGLSPCLVANCTMGYTVVTRVKGVEYRYTEWPAFNTLPTQRHKPNWAALRGAELYDHSVDPGETQNMLELNATPVGLRHTLATMLHNGP